MFTHKRTEYSYDPGKEEAVIRCSICTGEQVAGFKDTTTGVFHEVRLITNDDELVQFKKDYHLKTVKKMY